MGSQLERSTPEAEGIASAAILEFVEAVEQQLHDMHSFMLVRHGCVVAEGWWSPYRPESPHMLFSLSKSFTSTGIGLAVMEGRLSVDDPVLSFFPDETPAQVSENLAAMRVRHLLSMSTGHAEDTTGYLWKRQDGNWTQAFFDLPVVYAPGTHFLYNSGATYLLSAIVQKLTGMRLLDYLQPRLLEPLGIENATWEVSPQGINSGGWGMNIRTEDIAHFGQMYLQKGMWQGKRILTEAWVDEATTRQISNGSSPNSDWEQGYCYQFWRSRHNSYRGDGAFGQYCLVMPDQDAVLAITSGLGDMQTPLNLVWDHLLPAMKPAPLPAAAVEQQVLARKLASLTISPPPGQSSSPLAARVSGRSYQVEANERGVETVSLEFSESQCVVAFKTAGGENRFTCGYGSWHEGTVPSPFDPAARVVASGVWTSEDTFTLTTRYYETPFVETMNCHFAGDQLTIEGDVNVSFAPQKYHWQAQLV